MIVYFISDDLRNYSDDGEEYVRAYWKKCEDENDDAGRMALPSGMATTKQVAIPVKMPMDV